MTIRHTIHTLKVEGDLKPGDTLHHEHGIKYTYAGYNPETGAHIGICENNWRHTLLDIPVWTKEAKK